MVSDYEHIGSELNNGCIQESYIWQQRYIQIISAASESVAMVQKQI